MEKKFYEIPQVESYQMDVEAGYSTSPGSEEDKTGGFDGEWVPLGGGGN